MSEEDRRQPFELDEAVALWVRAVASCGGGVAEEIEDHLRSEIESGVAAGLSEEAAFHAARQRLGDSDLLAKEFAKNRSIFELLCSADRTYSRSVTLKPGRLGLLVIIQSLAWATVMVAAAAIAPDAHESLSTLLLAGWFAGTMLPLTFLELGRNGRSEWACLKRLATGWLGRAA